jgi:O-6-methylguanine DNA methyltransferase
MKNTVPKITRLDKSAMPNSFGVANSPIGYFLAAWQDDMLVRLTLLPAHAEDKAIEYMYDYGWKHKTKRDDKRAEKLVKSTLFDGPHWQVSFPKDLKMGFYGTDFQHKIMAKMLAIPAGKTKQYQALDKAARAVGSVCARNPLPFIVPCHRVTASNDVGNYGYGSALKRQLLAWEAA